MKIKPPYAINLCLMLYLFRKVFILTDKKPVTLFFVTTQVSQGKDGVSGVFSSGSPKKGAPSLQKTLRKHHLKQPPE